MSIPSTKGITFVDVIAIVVVVLILIAVSYVIFSPHEPGVPYDRRCKSNLKAFDSALALYRNDFNQKYPDYSGVKFVAVLYRCGYLCEKEYFLCPAREDADWVETGDNKTAFKFEKPAAGAPYSQNWDPKFEPWEITYAGRRNDPNDEGGRFCLANGAIDPTPVVSDSTLNHKGENNAEYAPHNGAVNVLLTNGSIIKLKGVAVGQKAPSGNTTDMDLESLQND